MKLSEIKDISNKLVTEVIRDANYNGDNEYKVTYTTNAGNVKNTRKIYAKSIKDAVMFVSKRLGNPITINGQDIDFKHLENLMDKN